MASEEVIQDGASYLWGGMDSYTMPVQVGGNEYVAGMNVVCRGGLVKTRPGSRTMFCLPEGNIQGGAFFNPTNGEPHIVVAVDGYIYVSPAPFSEYRLLPNIRFGATSEYVSFTECLQSTFYDEQGIIQFYDTPFSVLVMQDGNTRAAYWDGSTSEHLDPTPANRPDGLTEAGKDGTKIGLWSVWSNNRLWVSFNNVLYASDIGNPLKFTEAQYLNEGRAFYLPGTCTGLVELPDQSGIIAFTENNGTFFQSSIQDRTQWLQTPDFQKLILPKVGCVAPLSITTQYGLIWWFSPKGVISLDGAFRQNLSSRLSIQDNEMLASKYGIGPKLNGICGAYFENYLLMSVPSYDGLNSHTWVLDQAVFEGEVKAWAGYWKGWRPVQWFRGSVNGDERIFFVSKDYDGGNRVWEAFLPEAKDNGTSITCFLQTKEHSFGGGYDLKKFRNAQLFIREMLGGVSLGVNVAGQRGGWQRIFTKEFVATEGQVYANEEYEVGGNLFAGNRPQTRVVQTQVLGAPNECQVCEIESDIPIGVDRAFSLWFIWQGVMGIEAYRLFALTQQENLDGECKPDESGFKSLEFCGDSAAAKFVDCQETLGVSGPDCGGGVGGNAAIGDFSAAFTKCYTSSGGEVICATQDGSSVISQAAAERIAQERAEVAAAEEVASLPVLLPPLPCEPSILDVTGWEQVLPISEADIRKIYWTLQGIDASSSYNGASVTGPLDGTKLPAEREASGDSATISDTITDSLDYTATVKFDATSTCSGGVTISRMFDGGVFIGYSAGHASETDLSAFTPGATGLFARHLAEAGADSGVGFFTKGILSAIERAPTLPGDYPIVGYSVASRTISGISFLELSYGEQYGGGVNPSLATLSLDDLRFYESGP